MSELRCNMALGKWEVMRNIVLASQLTKEMCVFNSIQFNSIVFISVRDVAYRLNRWIRHHRFHGIEFSGVTSAVHIKQPLYETYITIIIHLEYTSVYNRTELSCTLYEFFPELIQFFRRFYELSACLPNH